MDYANTIHASAKSLLNIINDILDLSKVDAGMMKLSYDWFHPRSLVEEVNEMVCTMAITKRLELNYIVDNDVPEMVKGDKFRIRQVLLNVVGNAIKFTDVGEVFSRCRVMKNPGAVEEDEIMLEFSVIDTGRGFTKQEAELMFKPFSQIDGSSTRQHGGSGLGLVISRTLVELHGGKMEGSAVPGEGSTFVFTAKFGRATPEDHPEPALTPQIMPPLLSRTSSASAQIAGAVGKRFAKELVDSPRGESNPTSPAVLSSSASTSSSRSIHSHSTQRSSRSSTTNLSHFGEAAKSGSQDATTMKFTIPERLKSPTFTPSVPFGTQDELSRTMSGSDTEKKSFRPPMYSILLICPQTHSREATTQHIENTLPKDVPHQITPLASIAEAQDLIAGEDPINFTHIVLNLGVAEEIVSVVEMIRKSATKPTPSLVILSDPVERQEVIKLGAAYDYEQLAKDNQVTFIYKPVKPSRFAVVFDPEKERDLSTDRNRFSAQQQVASQKQNYLDVAKRLGNKGFKVLLVEDNLVNQKVLLKYLSKIGIAVELALDGVECVDKVFSKPYSHYSLILVSQPCCSRLYMTNGSNSAIFTCHEKTAIKHVARYDNGRKRTNIPPNQSLHCQQMSWRMYWRSVFKLVSVIMLLNQWTSRL
jgi:CheY-like chemotaxis protein